MCKLIIDGVDEEILRLRRTDCADYGTRAEATFREFINFNQQSRYKSYKSIIIILIVYELIELSCSKHINENNL